MDAGAHRGGDRANLLGHLASGVPLSPTLKKKVNNNFRPETDDEYRDRRAADNKRVDAILDKISKGGYDSITKEEKDFLFRHGRK